MKLVFYSILIVAISIMDCDAERSNNNVRSVAKRACVPLGGLCETSKDCCASADPDSGHCVGCWKHGSSIIPWGHSRCTCDSTDTVGIDPVTNVVITDMCRGHDKAKTRCVTRVAPPGHRYFRGKKLF